MTCCPGGYDAQAQAANETEQQRQKQRQRDPWRAKQAAADLASLMRQKLDVNVDPVALRLFLKVYWSRVETLAHTIHNNED